MFAETRFDPTAAAPAVVAPPAAAAAKKPSDVPSQSPSPSKKKDKKRQRKQQQQQQNNNSNEEQGEQVATHTNTASSTADHHDDDETKEKQKEEAPSEKNTETPTKKEKRKKQKQKQPKSPKQSEEETHKGDEPVEDSPSEVNNKTDTAVGSTAISLDPKEEDATTTKKEKVEVKVDERTGMVRIVKPNDSDQKVPVVMTQTNANNNEAANDNADDGSHHSDDCSSSSAPSSDSDDSDDEEEEVIVKESSSSMSMVKVIAPDEANQSSNALRKKRMGGRGGEEGMDDFDIVMNTNGDGNNNNAIMTQEKKEFAYALKVAQMPLLEVATKLWQLPQFLIDNLQHEKHTHFFPIQCLVVPDVIRSEQHCHSHTLQTRDICVAAPTGSGKTLSFVLPILQSLSMSSSGGSGDSGTGTSNAPTATAHTAARRLRALIVLPSRDLALQVYEVFRSYAKGSSLNIGLAIGQTNFEEEQQSLILGGNCGGGNNGSGNNHGRNNHNNRTHVTSGLAHVFDPLHLTAALGADYQTRFNSVGGNDIESSRNKLRTRFPAGGRSAVDVLVCTPGRLKDHLEQTSAAGFTLQHLRFLVMDEADRLLNQSYHGWISKVTQASNVQNLNTSHMNTSHIDNRNIVEEDPDDDILSIDPVTWRKQQTSRSTSRSSSTTGGSSMCGRPVPLRKLLFSATMTKDPQKLAAMGLVHPKFYDAHQMHTDMSMVNNNGNDDDENKTSTTQSTQHYSLPPGLKEYTVECTLQQKALVLLALILEELAADNTRGLVVVFTSSLESTHRLARLLQLLWATCEFGSSHQVAEYSSLLNQKQRSALVKKCKDSVIKIVVCSDGMARGMDVPSVTTVIHYDIPSFAKTYVHRCGRTARAGRSGTAISLLQTQRQGSGGSDSNNNRSDAQTFRKFRKLIDCPEQVIQGRGIRKELVQEAVQQYAKCAQKLQQVLQLEQEGKLNALSPLGSSWTTTQKEEEEDLSSESSSDDDDDDSDDDGSSVDGSTGSNDMSDGE
jgi:superfamily II DNA/RNA helicase